MRDMIGRDVKWEAEDGLMAKGEKLTIVSWDTNEKPPRMRVRNRFGRVVGGLDMWFQYGEPFKLIQVRK